MLQALLGSAGLTTEDLEVELYPTFGQLGALQQDAIDAATGFRNNEPVQLRLAGEDVTVLAVDDITPLPGNGLITGAATLGAKKDALKAFVAATLRAMAEITADPQVGLEAAIVRIPELAADRETQLAVLRATIEIWESPYTREHGLGAIDRDAWEQTIEFMRTLPGGIGPGEVAVDQLVTEELLGD
jgi:NitT/TauT family transport system substrate-binding protein